MKTKAEHTPLPWMVQHHPTLGPIILSGDGPDATDVLQDLRMQDAAFIVQCVNAYNNNEEIVRWAKDAAKFYRLNDKIDFSDSMMMLEKAISRAEGK